MTIDKFSFIEQESSPGFFNTKLAVFVVVLSIFSVGLLSWFTHGYNAKAVINANISNRIFRDYYSGVVLEPIDINSFKKAKVPSFYKAKYMQKHVLNGGYQCLNLGSYDDSVLNNFCEITQMSMDGNLLGALNMGFKFTENVKIDGHSLKDRLCAYQLLRNIAISTMLNDQESIKRSLNDFISASGWYRDGEVYNTEFKNNLLGGYCELERYKNLSFKDFILDLVSKYL